MHAGSSPCSAWRLPSRRVSSSAALAAAHAACVAMRRCRRRRLADQPAPLAPPTGAACSDHPRAAQQEHGQAAGRLPVPRGVCRALCAGSGTAASAAADAQTPARLGSRREPCPGSSQPLRHLRRLFRQPACTALPRPVPTHPCACRPRRPRRRARRLRGGARRTRRPTPRPRSSLWASATRLNPSHPSSQTPCRRPPRGWARRRGTAGAWGRPRWGPTAERGWPEAAGRQLTGWHVGCSFAVSAHVQRWRASGAAGWGGRAGAAGAACRCPAVPLLPPSLPPADPPLPLPRSYGAEQGRGELREAICRRLYEAVGRKPNEIFVSDGSKCDIGRLQLMFGADVTVALQVGRGGCGGGGGGGGVWWRCRRDGGAAGVARGGWRRCPSPPACPPPYLPSSLTTHSPTPPSLPPCPLTCLPTPHPTYPPACLPTCPLPPYPPPTHTRPQDPAYPVYVDSSVIMGMTGEHDGTGFAGIQYMVCRPDTDFFPDLSKARAAAGGGACRGGLPGHVWGPGGGGPGPAAPTTTEGLLGVRLHMAQPARHTCTSQPARHSLHTWPHPHPPLHADLAVPPPPPHPHTHTRRSPAPTSSSSAPPTTPRAPPPRGSS